MDILSSLGPRAPAPRVPADLRPGLAEAGASRRKTLLELGRRRGLSEADAEDVVQNFLLHLVQIDQAGGATLDPERDPTPYLRAAFGNFAQSEQASARTVRKGGGVTFLSLDEPRSDGSKREVVTPGRDPGEALDAGWVLRAVRRTLRQMAGRARVRGRTKEFRALRTGLADATAMRNLAGQLGIVSSSARSLTRRFRHEFATGLRAEVETKPFHPVGLKEDLNLLRPVLTQVLGQFAR